MMYGTNFSTEVSGTTYDARYHVSGKKVIVLSIYGERGATYGKEPALPVAQRLLRELVQRRLEEKSSRRPGVQ